jgi:hypothetical protein
MSQTVQQSLLYIGNASSVALNTNVYSPCVNSTFYIDNNFYPYDTNRW